MTDTSLKSYIWTKEWQEEYTDIIKQVSIYPTGDCIVKADNGDKITVFLQEWYLVPALAGEVGELTSIYAKLLRDKKGDMEDEDIDNVLKELGDILFMVTSLANLYGYSLSEVASFNAAKLLDRQKRGKIQGSGDNR
jgi:NTP pyrophosphatase (non-canonical NTP hydrolase)